MKLITSLNWLIFRDTWRIRADSSIFWRYLFATRRGCTVEKRTCPFGSLLLEKNHVTTYRGFFWINYTILLVTSFRYRTVIEQPGWSLLDDDDDITPRHRETWRKEKKKKKKKLHSLGIDYASIHDFTDPKGARLLFEREGAWQVRETGWTGERERKKYRQGYWFELVPRSTL